MSQAADVSETEDGGSHNPEVISCLQNVPASVSDNQ